MLETECQSRDDVAGYQECMKNIYLTEDQVPPPSDPFENLLTLQKVRYEMSQYFLQPALCDEDFLVVAKATAKDLLDVPKEPE